MSYLGGATRARQQRAGFYARGKFLQVIHLRNRRNGRKSKDLSLQIKRGAAAEMRDSIIHADLSVTIAVVNNCARVKSISQIDFFFFFF